MVAVACLSLLVVPMGSMASLTHEIAPSCFFIQSADTAILNSSKLVLVEPDAAPTVWFADAPSTDTGVMPSWQYLHLLWGEPTSHFNQHHPNASLVGDVVNPVTHQLESVDVIMRLEKASEVNHHLVYQVHIISPKSSLIDSGSSITLHHIALFVDPYICPWCD
jgi:hypothetical protein